MTQACRQEIKWRGCFFVNKWTFPPQNETKLNQTLLCTLHTSYAIITVCEVVNQCFFSSYRSGVVNVKQLVNCNIVSLESVFFRCLTYFLFYILLIWGGVRRHPTHPPAYGPDDVTKASASQMHDVAITR